MQRQSSLFDCWAEYGPRPQKDPAERWTLEQLRADLDFAGFGGALVRHSQALHYDPMLANRRLADELADHADRLHPCWLAMPSIWGDFPDPETLLEEMVERRVRALWFAPATQAYPIHEDVLAPLARAVSARGTLLALPVGEAQRDYRDLTDFCRVFQANPVLLAEASWSDWRLVTAVMDACPNAHLEFSAMQGNRAVEWFADRYGAERCLLGTGLPSRAAGAARGFVDWSLMDKTSVAAFAGGNLARLLRVPQPTARTEPADEIMRAAWAGEPVPVPVLDAHCHVLDDGLDGAGANYVMPKGDFRHMLDLARRIGVDLTAMMSWSGTVANDAASGNALLEKLASRGREEAIFLASCDPTHQTQEEIADLCARLYDGLGFRGMKPYVRTGISYADPGYSRFWECAAQHHLYGLLHISCQSGGMRAAAQLAIQYPTVMFLIAHSGMSWSFARQVAELAETYPNIGAELTYTAATNGVIEWLCAQIGCRRICFGTDAPMRDPRPQLAWCVNTRLHPNAKRDILGRNFARVLSRAHLPGHPFPAAAAEALASGRQA